MMADDDTHMTVPTYLLPPEPLSVATRSVFAVLYVQVIIVALLGNVTVIVVIVANKSMRSVTNICFVSLAISDIIIAAWTMPMTLTTLLRVEWLLGRVMCLFTGYIQGVSVASSILTLVAVSVDRYYAICKPVVVARRLHTPRRAIVMLLLIWIASFLLLIPQTFLSYVHERLAIDPIKDPPERIIHICRERGDNVSLLYGYTYFMFCCLYALPTIVIVVAYGNIAHRLWIRAPVGDILANPQLHYRHIYQKKRVIRLLMTIVAVFTICWLPYFSLHIYTLNHKEIPMDRVMVASIQLWGYLNCALNPIIYATMSENFHYNMYNMNFCFVCTRRANRKTVASITVETYNM